MTDLPSATEIVTRGVLWTVGLALVWVWLEGLYYWIDDLRRR